KGDPSAEHLASQLSNPGQVRFYQLVDGLRVETTSFVGSIRLGQLHLTIHPKIDGIPLLRLLKYGYGLRDLQLFNPNEFSTQKSNFLDLLILQLISEVEELISRGLLRRYVKKEEPLSNPIGRINFQQLARQGGLIDATLPCVFYHRLENCLHNQVILSGLLRAAHQTEDIALRVRTRRLASLMQESVQVIRLNQKILERVEQESNRLTEAYRPAITLVALLFGEQGIQTDDKAPQVQLNGYLFDMNRFFQALLSRLLNENLAVFHVKDEHHLKGFLTYIPGFDLPHRPDPLPRPDFAVFKGDKLVALLDTKYRDIWNQGLPREMLYQLIVYALSRHDHRSATILYPSLDLSAHETRIQINEPLLGLSNGMVILRPVNLSILEHIIRQRDTKGLSTLATELVFGKKGDIINCL
ncbi:MAG: restriction endonuclease, partial [Anaerolineaceae bacterium]